MKNCTKLPSMFNCYKCNCRGFFVTTPHGGDYTDCPCCGEYDFLMDTLNHEWNKGRAIYDKLNDLFDQTDDHDNDMRLKYKYCVHCGILFDSGCYHYVGGCTDNIYCAHFIKQWRDKSTGAVYTTGMPQFDNAEDWFEHANDVEVIDMVCPHKGTICSRASENEDHTTKRGHYYGCSLSYKKVNIARNQGS